MIGYIYKTTNLITGQYYYGKREYRKDLESNTLYLGSGIALMENVKQYGENNFKKVKIEECDTLEHLAEREAHYINMYYRDDLCLNYKNGTGYGGIYETGICKLCSKQGVIYTNSGLCMRCILGESEKYYCDKCKRETYHYKSGKCMSCVAYESHKHKWCDFCQSETSHFSNKCKSHSIKLIKNEDGTISVKLGTNRSNRIIIKDISIIDKLNVTETPRSVAYNLPKGIKIKSNNKFTELQTVLFNKNVTNWLKITYKYDCREDHIRTITLTTDHPLPVKDKGVIQANELEIGDYLYRVNPNYNSNCHQNKFAVITKIEKLDRTARSYDVTTENHYFDINQDILSHNCRSFLSPWKDENGNYKFYGRLTA